MRILINYKNAKASKNEYFVVTPYLFISLFTGKTIKYYGVGISWGFYSIEIGIGFKFPKEYPSIKNVLKKYV